MRFIFPLVIVFCALTSKAEPRLNDDQPQRSQLRQDLENLLNEAKDALTITKRKRVKQSFRAQVFLSKQDAVKREKDNQPKEPTDPDESNANIKKLSKHTHENYEKKANNETIISKGMNKHIVNKDGETAQKTVKESEDKKPNGETVVDKEADLEIDHEPNSDPVDPEAGINAEGLKQQKPKQANNDPTDLDNGAENTFFAIINIVVVTGLAFLFVF